MARGCTRAEAVRVIEELDAWRVFGEHGWRVGTVITQSALLDRDDAAALASARDDRAGDAFRRAWQAWSQLGTSGCPIGHGLVLVSGAVQHAAMSIDRSLLSFDPVDGVDVLDDPTWIAARMACLEAAMAYGAPDLLSRVDTDSMCAAWQERFNCPGDR